MVELFIEGRRAQLSEDMSADLTYSLADIRTPEKRQVNFSKTLTLIGNSTNNEIFGNVFDIDVENPANDPGLPNVGINYTAKKLAKAQILADGVQIFDGTLRLWKITIKEGVVFYETSVFGKLFDLFGSLGESKLTDIDFSDYNHALTWPNIKATWEDTYEGAFRYPFIDFGSIYLDSTGKPATLRLGSLSPCIHYKVYLDKIFSSVGASYGLNFDDQTQELFDKLLVTPSKGGAMGRPSFFKADLVPDGVSNTYFSVAGTTHELIRITNREVIDVLGLYTTSDNLRLTFTINQELSLQYAIWHNSYRFGATSDITFKVMRWRSGVATEIASSGSQITGTATNRLTIVEVERQQFLSGDVVYVNVTVPSSTTVKILTTSQIQAISPVDQTEYPLISGDIYDMQKAVPENIKQVDFVKDFIRLFNLMVTQSPDNPALFVFTPNPNFYTSTLKNWTNKLDHSERVEITPINQLTAKEYKFTWKDDKDYWNELYKQQNNETYGQVTYIVDTDIVTKTETIESIFSPAIMQRFENSAVLCPGIYKVEEVLGLPTKKIDRFNPRLLIWGGLQSAGHNIALLNTNLTTHSTVTTYPYCGHLDHPTAPSYDLNFGNTNSDMPTATKNQFSQYWGAALRAAAHKDARLISCTMLLKPEDIENLDFGATYQLGAQHYRLNKVIGYNPFEISTCKVELIKVLSL